jgi:hypothetical protein
LIVIVTIRSYILLHTAVVPHCPFCYYSSVADDDVLSGRQKRSRGGKQVFVSSERKDEKNGCSSIFYSFSRGKLSILSIIISIPTQTGWSLCRIEPSCKIPHARISRRFNIKNKRTKSQRSTKSPRHTETSSAIVEASWMINFPVLNYLQSLLRAVPVPSSSCPTKTK